MPAVLRVSSVSRPVTEPLPLVTVRRGLERERTRENGIVCECVCLSTLRVLSTIVRVTQHSFDGRLLFFHFRFSPDIRRSRNRPLIPGRVPPRRSPVFLATRSVRSSAGLASSSRRPEPSVFSLALAYPKATFAHRTVRDTFPPFSRSRLRAAGVVRFRPKARATGFRNQLTVASMIMAWQPQEEGLRQIIQLLKESQSPDTIIQRTVQQVSFFLDLNFCVSFPSSTLLVPARSGRSGSGGRC